MSKTNRAKASTQEPAPAPGVVKNELRQTWTEPKSGATTTAPDDELLLDDDLEGWTPVERFIHDLDRSKKYTLTVWFLPRYAQNGIASIGRGSSERTWLCKMQMTEDDFEEFSYRANVQRLWPYGGTFQFELRGPRADDDGRFSLMKRWEEDIAALPETERVPYSALPAGSGVGANVMPPPGYQPYMPHVYVGRDPDKETPAIDPFDILERQADGFVKVATVLQKLQGGGAAAAGPAAPSANDRLVDLLMTKVAKDDSVSLRDIGRMFFGRGDDDDDDRPRRSRSFMDSFGEGLGNGLGKFLETIAPVVGAQTINWYQTRTATGTGAQTQPQLTGTATTQSQQQQPAQNRWVRLIVRIIEDCAENVAIAPSAEAIIDLCNRSAEAIPIIQRLLHAAPADVFDMAAQFIQGPTDQQRVRELKTDPVCVEWIAKLQKETLRIAAEVTGAARTQPQQQQEEASAQ